MERFDLLIVGGGISGLSLAHFCLRPGLRVALLEAEQRPGGALATHRVEDGFWLELGAHTCYNSYGRLLEILEARGLGGRVLPRRRLRWAFALDGGVRSVASELRWGELLLHLPRLLTAPKAGRSVADYYGRVLGPGNYRRVAAPMLDAVASQDSGGFPAGMLFKQRPRRKDVPRSFTLAGGLGSIAEAIAAQQGLTVLTGQRAAAVTREGEGWRVRTAGGEDYSSSSLGLACPPDVGAALLRGVAPEAAQVLGGIAVREVHSVGVVVEAGRTALPPVAGLVGREDRFFSMVTRDPVEHPSLRGFAFHFRPETEAAERSGRIAAVLGIAPGDILHRSERVNRLPAPVLGHEARMAGLERLLAGGSLLVTGNFFGGLAIEDCVSRSHAEAGRFHALAATHGG